MDILKPPTDNVYKFVAISGVALVLIAFWWPIQNRRDSRSKQATLERTTYERLSKIRTLTWPMEPVEEVETLSSVGSPPPAESTAEDRKAWLKDISSCESKLSHAIVVSTIRKFTTPNVAQIDELKKRGLLDQDADPKQESIRQGIQQRENMLEVSDILREVRSDCSDIWRMQDDIHYYRNLGIYGIIIGGCLSLCGFGSWWWKVQRHQDYMLRAERETKCHKHHDMRL